MSYFIGKNDDSQNMFIYQPTLDTWQRKYKKTSENIISCKSKGVYTSNLKPLHGSFLPKLEYFAKKVCVNLDNFLLIIEQNNYSTKIRNTYIIYDLDGWTKVPIRNFAIKNCLFGAANIIKKSDKEKYVYSNHGIEFDGKGEWSFGNDYAKNVVVFEVDNILSSHTDNLKNDFIILGDGLTFGINERFGASEKKIKFSKAKTNFCLNLQ